MRNCKSDLQIEWYNRIIFAENSVTVMGEDGIEEMMEWVCIEDCDTAVVEPEQNRMLINSSKVFEANQDVEVTVGNGKRLFRSGEVDFHIYVSWKA